MLFKAINPALLPAIRSAIQTRYVGSSGGVVIDPNAKYVAATGGSDSPASGSIGSPYATVNYAISQMSAGDTLYFRSGTHTTTADLAIGSLNGSTFERYPLDASAVILDGSATYEGFRVQNSINNTFKNMTLQNFNGNGAMIFDDACSGGLAENMIAQNIDTLVAGGNIAGFYLCTASTKLADNITIRNCRAYDVTINSGTGSQSNASGIHSYGAQNCTIENFTAHSCGNGIFWKRSTGTGNNTVSKCLFYDLIRGVRYTTDGGNPTHVDQTVTESIFYNISQNAWDCELSGTLAINTGFEFSNNVVDDSKFGAVLLYLQNPQIFNNVFYNLASPGYAIAHYPDTVLAADDLDYNDYYSTTRWVYDRYDAGEATYNTLASWQSGQSQDTNSVTDNPTFEDIATRDYRLASGSPLIGAGVGGVNIGAYKTGSETIGATV